MKMNLLDLKKFCKDRGWKGYSSMKKSKLIEFITKNKNTTMIAQEQVQPKKTNETYGMSCEAALCEVFQIDHSISESRVSRTMIDQIKSKLNKETLGFKLSKHIGKQNKVDFLTTNNETVSVKTNSSGYKVCPQVIGQTTKKKFCEFFGVENLSVDEIKELMYENIDKMIDKYLDHLFCCDYLIWIGRDRKDRRELKNGKEGKNRRERKDQMIKIFHRKEMLEKYKNLNLLNLTWTRTLNQWNESNTLKANGKTMAEFQIHSHRNSIKMRFDLKFFMQERQR